MANLDWNKQLVKSKALSFYALSIFLVALAFGVVTGRIYLKASSGDNTLEVFTDTNLNKDKGVKGK